MKRLLVIIGLLLLVGILSAACADAEPEEDIPRYTADQVIAVAQAAYPEIPIELRGQCKQLSWKVLYRYDGVWLVVKRCIDAQGNDKGLIDSWLFDEDTGTLREYTVPQ